LNRKRFNQAGNRSRPDPGQTTDEALILKPVGPGGGGQAPLPVYLRQVIARLNSIFGEATPLTDKVAFVNHIADIAREDANTMAQVENNLQRFRRPHPSWIRLDVPPTPTTSPD
jgi:hypothetical protein